MCAETRMRVAYIHSMPAGSMSGVFWSFFFEPLPGRGLFFGVHRASFCIHKIPRVKGAGRLLCVANLGY